MTVANIGFRGMRVNSRNAYMRLFMNHLTRYVDSIDEMMRVGGDSCRREVIPLLCGAGAVVSGEQTAPSVWDGAVSG